MANIRPPHPDSEEHCNLVRLVVDSLDASYQARSKEEVKWRDSEEQMWLVKQSVQKVFQRAKGLPGDKAVDLRELSERVHVPIHYSLNWALLGLFNQAVSKRDPILPLFPMSPDDVDPALLMESLLAWQANQRKLWLTFFKSAYSGLTYGAGILKNYWAKDERTVLSYPDDFAANPRLIEEQYTEYEGNHWDYVSPYDFFHDPSVPIGDLQDGKFVVHRTLISDQALKEAEDDGRYFYTDKAVERTGSDSWDIYEREGDAELWGNPLHGPRTYMATEVAKSSYAFEWIGGLVPNDERYRLGATKRAVKWMLTVCNGVLIGSEPWTYHHGRYPYPVWEPHPVIQTPYRPSFAHLQSGLAKVADWSLNFRIDSGRRSANGWIFVDIDAVEDMKAFETNNPLKIIPVRRFGNQPMSDIAHQLPFRDASAGAVADMSMAWDILQKMFAVSEGSQGQFAKGRRTATETNVVRGGTDARTALVADLFITQAVSEISRQSVANNQQFQTEGQYVRLFGERYTELVQRLQEKQAQTGGGPYLVNVDRQTIAGNFDYPANLEESPAQGAERGQVWAQLLQIMAEVNPAIMQSEGKMIKLTEILKMLALSMGVKNFRDAFLMDIPQQQGQPQPGGAEQAPPIGGMGA